MGSRVAWGCAMSAPHSALDRMLSGPTECRVGHIWGGAPWHPISEIGTVRSWVDAGNMRHGAKSHWLEMR